MNFQNIFTDDFNIFPCLKTERLKNSNKVIGTCGIAPEGFDKIHDCNNIGLGFDLDIDYWKKGFMKEAIKKIIVYCFNKPQVKKMHLENLGDNINCTKLAKKLNFIRLKTTENVEIMPKVFSSLDYYELERQYYENNKDKYKQ